ncbi:hypothetical protein KFL_000180360 [Klebsormidium nitens]|uniref:SPT2 chromatin protein n=1 Tax=Klebsormidium nitens TaxID=105231 RepID=A0A1Y1HLA7_KLENI|nr:hypothetical protein KFL_000180360 [Klebsormidium nitens]|eukprot:GAQ78753.1 hypothetical protein KFL_000180360 [Klebsormidium nitens]
MFYDNRVNLKESRDYSFLTTSKASKADREDGASEDRNGGAGRSSQSRGATTGGWGGFFGSKPEKSAAERLAELQKMREQAEQEKARRELERIRADRIAASKKASVSAASSGTSQRSGGSSAGSKKSDAMQKIQELEKHTRAQALKQARDFSDLLGNGEPAKPRASDPGGAFASAKRSLETLKQKVDDYSESIRRRNPETVSKAPKVAVQPPKAPVTPKHSVYKDGRQKGDQRAPREADRKPGYKEPPSKGGLAISSLATITPEGALVANSGISLEDAKRLKQGAKLLGMKLYFEKEDKQRLKEEKAAQERRAAGKGGAASGRPANGSGLGAKSEGSANGGMPRSLDEERRRGGGLSGLSTAAPRKSEGGLAQSGRPGVGGHAREKAGGNAHRNGSSGHDRAPGGGGRREAFPPFRGPVKRKRPEEEMEDADSFLDEGEEEDEEGPSQEAVSSMIRKMFRYNPHKYVADDRDDPMMEVGFKRMQAEEARSARIAREEDEREAERLELEERRREEKRRKKTASKGKFVDD